MSYVDNPRPPKWATDMPVAEPGESFNAYWLRMGFEQEVIDDSLECHGDANLVMHERVAERAPVAYQQHLRRMYMSAGEHVRHRFLRPGGIRG